MKIKQDLKNTPDCSRFVYRNKIIFAVRKHYLKLPDKIKLDFLFSMQAFCNHHIERIVREQNENR